jgi:hypothetical protein
MGFFNALKDILGGGKCPACGTPGVRKSGNEIRCLNPTCQYFNPSMEPMGLSQPPEPPQPAQQPQQQPQATSSGWKPGPGQPSGAAPAGSVAIQYKNFQGQFKTFSADAASLHREKNHIIARVAPKGKQISLSRDRIQNLEEVERQMPKRVAPGQNWPTARERQVLNYHKKHGTTSALYEKVRAKYPNW